MLNILCIVTDGYDTGPTLSPLLACTSCESLLDSWVCGGVSYLVKTWEVAPVQSSKYSHTHTGWTWQNTGKLPNTLQNLFSDFWTSRGKAIKFEPRSQRARRLLTSRLQIACAGKINKRLCGDTWTSSWNCWFNCRRWVTCSWKTPLYMDFSQSTKCVT